jgi:hypothetical protein
MSIAENGSDTRLQQAFAEAKRLESEDPYNPGLILDTDMLAFNLRLQAQRHTGPTSEKK